MSDDIISLLERLVDSHVITNEEKPLVLKTYSELHEKMNSDSVYKMIKENFNPQITEAWKKFGLISPEVGPLLTTAIFVARLQRVQEDMLKQPPQMFFPIIDLLGKKCPSCSQLNIFGADYCVKCGKQLKV